MKAVELRQLSIEELKKRLTDEQENLSNLRFQLATSQLESPISVRSVRRDIARLKTLIVEKERAAAQEGPSAAEPATKEQDEVKPS
jgi:large subunit ribosomal protein L29